MAVSMVVRLVAMMAVMLVHKKAVQMAEQMESNWVEKLVDLRDAKMVDWMVGMSAQQLAEMWAARKDMRRAEN